MSKRYFKVDDVLKHLGHNAVLRSGIIISLLSLTDMTIKAASDIDFLMQPQTELVSSMRYSWPLTDQVSVYNTHDVEYFLGSTFSVCDMLDDAFNSLKERQPLAAEIEETYCLIRDGIGEIFAERVSVNYDATSKVVNVAYRLPGDILLSVSKPFNTMDDDYVMFNLFHLRKLLISDTADINLLSHYIHRAEQKASQIA